MNDRSSARAAHHQGLETLAGEATLDACEASSGRHVRGALPELHGNGRRVRVAPPGACGLHFQSDIVSRDMRTAPLGSTQVPASKRVRGDNM